MPRYLVERSFPEGLAIPVDEGGPGPARSSSTATPPKGSPGSIPYVTPDKRTTCCVYDGPSPEAIRRAAETNQLPVDRITEVRVLDPYFYR